MIQILTRPEAVAIVIYGDCAVTIGPLTLCPASNGAADGWTVAYGPLRGVRRCELCGQHWSAYPGFSVEAPNWTDFLKIDYADEDACFNAAMQLFEAKIGEAD